jgi:hypothetical protein
MPTIDKALNQISADLIDSLKEALPDLTVEVLVGFVTPFIKLYSAAAPPIKKQIDDLLGRVLLLIEYGAFF